MSEVPSTPRAALALTTRTAAVSPAVGSAAGRRDRIGLLFVLVEILARLGIRSSCVNSAMSAHVALDAETAPTAFEGANVSYCMTESVINRLKELNGRENLTFFSSVCIQMDLWPSALFSTDSEIT